jgi:Ran GTPase-activating protein (RanGAP) involved in mRNA processing and transport
MCHHPDYKEGMILNLSKREIKSIDFLMKYLLDHSEITGLDLSGNSLGNTEIKRVGKMLTKNTSILYCDITGNKASNNTMT